MSILFDKVARYTCNILINRPSKRNALNLDAIKSFQEAIRRFEEDDSLRIAIIGGVGGNFSSGYDLNEIVNPETLMPNMNQIQQMLWPLQPRLSMKKITIAAIEGHAAGFGWELALKCHFRVGDKDSRMGFMNRRFSIPIMNGGTVILPQLTGQARATELVTTGKAQLAPEALQYGLLNYVSDIGCALGRSLNLARCLGKFDQSALLHDLNSLILPNESKELELLSLERKNSIEYLKKCAPLDMVGKFLDGQLCRHGSFDMGNLMKPEPEVTL